MPDMFTPSGKVPATSALHNRWILSRLAQAVEASTHGIEDFRLDEGSGALYHFFWDELCDWFLELSKPIFASSDIAAKEEARAVLAYVLEVSLRALHPYIPFVTEELWQRMPKAAGQPKSVGLAQYPVANDGRIDADAEAQMAQLMGTITSARTIRSEYAVHPGAAIPLLLRTHNTQAQTLLESQLTAISTLVKTDGPPQFAAPNTVRPAGFVLSLCNDVEILVGLKGLVEADKERARIARNLARVDKDRAAIEKRMSNPSFADKAPPEVVAEAHAQLKSLSEQRERLLEAQQLADEL